ncbi:hypothetical protein ACLBYD_29750 [Rhodococcus sp. C26F]
MDVLLMAAVVGSILLCHRGVRQTWCSSRSGAIEDEFDRVS